MNPNTEDYLPDSYVLDFSLTSGSINIGLHCVSKKDTTQPPTIISTILVRLQ